MTMQNNSSFIWEVNITSLSEELVVGVVLGLNATYVGLPCFQMTKKPLRQSWDEYCYDSEPVSTSACVLGAVQGCSSCCLFGEASWDMGRDEC